MDKNLLKTIDSMESIANQTSIATKTSIANSITANNGPMYVDSTNYTTYTYATSGFSSIDTNNVFIDDSLKEKLVKRIIEDLDSELSSDVDIVVNYIRKRLSQIMDDPDNTVFKTENENKAFMNVLYNKIDELKKENDELRAIIDYLTNIVNDLQYQINNLKLSGTDYGNQTSTSPINPYPNSIGVMF